MSQFEGGKFKVRCIDCTKLSGSHCGAKNTKVSPKKKRLCSQYDFKGEYVNPVPCASVYMPPIDKKTRKMIKRLLEMGVVPVADDGSVEVQDGFARTKSLAMPASTATASLVGVKQKEDPIVYQTSDHEIVDPNMVFDSTDEYKDESEDNRG